MATAFPLPVTADQVGTYFVGQYYQMLQTQPDYAHQFYSESSTMIRIEGDGHTKSSASAMLQIHQLLTSLNYTGIEIKTVHSLESWNGGVLVMVSGSVDVNNFNGRKKFVETFLLAPQENGFFVFNDIFRYVDEEQILQPPIGYLPQSNFESKLHSMVTAREQVPNYMLGVDIHSRDFSPSKIEDDEPADNYNYPEEQVQQAPEPEKILEDNYVLHSNGTMKAVPTHFSSSRDEPAEEPQKHTYASIVAKKQSTQALHSQPPFIKPVPTECQTIPETANQPSVASSNPIERTGIEYLEEASAFEDEVEIKSVYVRNVPTTMLATEIGEEFKKFGKLSSDGVAIRTRKDIDVCYAFVEFEDISGVQNAIKASVVQIGSHQLYIEGRRPNRNNPIRGGRGRGRGRVSSYQMDGSRGRFAGRGFGRSSNNQDGVDNYYNNRPRGVGNNNGFYNRQQPQRAYVAANHQGSRNGHNSSE